MSEQHPVPGKDGDRYIPFEQRTGERSVVYFTRYLSEEGPRKLYDKIGSVLCGRVAIKLHTGEAEGPNIVPRPWVKALIDTRLPDAAIIETNTYFEGSRYTTEEHRKTLEINGWTFCPVDITDEDGVAELPVRGGKWFDVMHVGKNMLHYDSLLVLTHFKGHIMGGFGGSNKNIGIGCADGWSGAKNIATVNANAQTLSGTILVGSDSELTLNLSEGSSFTGAISGSIQNAKGETVSSDVGTVHVTLNTTSTWTLTADTYVSSFTGDASRIVTNGYSLYVNGVKLV